MISPGRYDEPISTHVYLSTWPRKNLLRLVTFSHFESQKMYKTRMRSEH
jgi:hypothetical protein